MAALEPVDEEMKEEMKDEHAEEGLTESISELVPEIGHYFTVLNKIGEGAFSKVYKARLKSYPEVQERFALKVLVPTCHPSRIENELRCLLHIGNVDNVMGVNLCLRQRDNVVIVMPYFPHDKFQEYIHLMAVPEAREYMHNLLIALRRVHHFSVIHRDVKPSNFLYSREAKKFALVDFGLASGNVLIDPDRSARTTLDQSRGAENANQAGGGQACGGDRPSTSLAPLSPSKKKLLARNVRLAPPRPPPLHVLIANSRKKKALQSPESGATTKSTPYSVAKTMMLKNIVQGLFCCCFGKPMICQFCMARRQQIAPRAGTAGFRSPEVLMKQPDQDTGVDMWSAGVMFLSVLSGRYPFFRAQDDLGYLAQIISLLGTEAVVQAAKSFGKELTVSEMIPTVDPKAACLKLRSSSTSSQVMTSWEKISDAPFDLLKRLLDPNPKTRISAEEALQHPWFSEDLGT